MWPIIIENYDAYFNPLFFSALLYPGFSQQSYKGEFVGHVLDEKLKRPLPFGTVQVWNSHPFGAVTNEIG